MSFRYLCKYTTAFVESKYSDWMNVSRPTCELMVAMSLPPSAVLWLCSCCVVYVVSAVGSEERVDVNEMKCNDLFKGCLSESLSAAVVCCTSSVAVSLSLCSTCSASVAVPKCPVGCTVVVSNRVTSTQRTRPSLWHFQQTNFSLGAVKFMNFGNFEMKNCAGALQPVGRGCVHTLGHTPTTG